MAFVGKMLADCWQKKALAALIFLLLFCTISMFYIVCWQVLANVVKNKASRARVNENLRPFRFLGLSLWLSVIYMYRHKKRPPITRQPSLELSAPTAFCCSQYVGDYKKKNLCRPLGSRRAAFHFVAFIASAAQWLPGSLPTLRPVAHRRAWLRTWAERRRAAASVAECVR